MASSIETTSTTTTLKNNGNTYLSVDTNDVVALTNPLPLASGGTGATSNAGKVLQCLQSTLTTAFTTTSTTYVDLLTLAITPSASSSKVFVSFTSNAGTNGDTTHLATAIFRGATEALPATSIGSRESSMTVSNTAAQQHFSITGCVLDSPSTTSETTYAIKVNVGSAGTGYWNRAARDNDAATHDGRTVTTLTAWEIGG
jgi:hypothetical protein